MKLLVVVCVIIAVGIVAEFVRAGLLAAQLSDTHVASDSVIQDPEEWR